MQGTYPPHLCIMMLQAASIVAGVVDALSIAVHWQLLRHVTVMCTSLAGVWASFSTTWLKLGTQACPTPVTIIHSCSASGQT